MFQTVCLKMRIKNFYGTSMCPLQTHFLLFQQIFFIQIFFVLVRIHPGTPRVPPRILASGLKTLRGQKRPSHVGFAVCKT